MRERESDSLIEKQRERRRREGERRERRVLFAETLVCDSVCITVQNGSRGSVIRIWK